MSKRSKKTRAVPVIKEMESGAVEKRVLFGRLARKEVGEKQERVAAKKSDADKLKTRERTKAEDAVETTTRQIADLEAALATIPESIRGAAEAELASLRTEQAEQQRLVEMNAENPEEHDDGKFEKIVDPTEREATYKRIESEMKRFVEDEKSLENLFSVCKGYEKSGWTNKELHRLVPFLEKQYLKGGAVAEQILRTYVENPTSLTQALRDEAKSRVEQIIKLRADEETKKITVQDPVLLQRLTAGLRQSFATPEKQAEIIKAYFADESVDKGHLGFHGPDAAVIAIREIVMSKGTASPDDIRTIMATFVAESNDYYVQSKLRGITDEDRMLLLKHKSSSWASSEKEAEEKTRLKKFGLETDGHPAINKAKGEIAAAEAAAAKVSALEAKFKEVNARDWEASIASQVHELVAKKAREFQGEWQAENAGRSLLAQDIQHVVGQFKDLRPSLELLKEQAKDGFVPELWDGLLGEVQRLRGVVSERQKRVKALENRTARNSMHDSMRALESNLGNSLPRWYREEQEGRQVIFEQGIHGNYVASGKVLAERTDAVQRQIDEAKQRIHEKLVSALRETPQAADQAFRSEVAETFSDGQKVEKQVQDAMKEANALLDEFLVTARKVIGDARDTAKYQYEQQGVAVGEYDRANGGKIWQAKDKVAQVSAGMFKFLKKGEIDKAEAAVVAVEEEAAIARQLLKEKNAAWAKIQQRLDRVS